MRLAAKPDVAKLVAALQLSPCLTHGYLPCLPPQVHLLTRRLDESQTNSKGMFGPFAGMKRGASIETLGKHGSSASSY